VKAGTSARFTFTVGAVVIALLASGRSAGARQGEPGTKREDVPSPVEAARTGAASPLLLNASLSRGQALAVGSGGYDTARSAALFDSAAEVRIWGPIAVRAGVTYSDGTQRMRPSVGARVQLFRQAAHGVDGSLSGSFKAEGFNEMEGELETTFALGRRFQQFYLLGNVAYGQDPEGRERDGEVRAAVLRPQGRMVWGIEARGRSAIGGQHAPSSALEPRMDAIGGAVGMLSLSNLVLFAEIGPSAVKMHGTDLRWGVASIGGVCALF
jgi:hypothetical protein